MMAEVPGERDVLAKGFENLVQKEKANAASVAEAANAGPPPAAHNPPTMLRGAFYNLVTMAAFDNFILFCIAINCVTMAMTRPAMADADDKELEAHERMLPWISLALGIIFFLEMVFKMIAFGFFQKKMPGTKQPPPGCFENGYPGSLIKLTKKQEL